MDEEQYKKKIETCKYCMNKLIGLVVEVYEKGNLSFMDAPYLIAYNDRLIKLFKDFDTLKIGTRLSKGTDIMQIKEVKDIASADMYNILIYLMEYIKAAYVKKGMDIQSATIVIGYFNDAKAAML